MQLACLDRSRARGGRAGPKHRGDAYRLVYALQIGDDIWVIHAFQTKSKTGIKTPKAETELIDERLSRLKERLR